MKCFRTIFKTTTTYIDRNHTNDYIRKLVNDNLRATKHKPVKPLTASHTKSRIKYLSKLITHGASEPGAAVTFNRDSLEPIDWGKKRVGQPRLAWYKVTMQDLWNEAKHTTPETRFAGDFDPQREVHARALRAYAKNIEQQINK